MPKFIKRFNKKIAGRIGRYYKLGKLPAVFGYLKYKRSKKPVKIKATSYYTAPIALRLGTDDLSMFWNIFDGHEYGLKASKPVKTILDLGANVGFASVYFANLFPDATIIAVEPDAKNFQLLIENTKPYKNITCTHAAVWNESKQLHLSGNSSCSYRVDIPSNNGNDIKAITINSIIKDFAITNIDILKIDIEGSEKELFESSTEWLDKTSCIIIELHDRFKRGCSKSFYDATYESHPVEWHNSENVYVTRKESGFHRS